MKNFTCIFPGGGLFSSKPDAPTPLPPPPKLDDPAVDTAREKLRLSEKRRRGRRASILTSQSGTTEATAGIKRPEVLGQTGSQSSGNRSKL